MDFGPTATDIESASLFGQAVRSARHAILLADHTKFDAPALYRIVEWKSVAKIVTDRQPSDEWMQFFSSLQIQVIYPGSGSISGG
jgi:DeoR/GlpR family transcriptional regulator of sugar metabolism